MKLGLDKPLVVQFLYFLRDAFSGDFGQSLWQSTSVRELLRLEGILGGVSSGAVLHVARRLADELDEGVVVAVLADGGWKYLSADFWDAPDEDVETSMETTVWW